MFKPFSNVPLPAGFKCPALMAGFPLTQPRQRNQRPGQGSHSFSSTVASKQIQALGFSVMRQLYCPRHILRIQLPLRLGASQRLLRPRCQTGVGMRRTGTPAVALLLNDLRHP